MYNADDYLSAKVYRKLTHQSIPSFPPAHSPQTGYCLSTLLRKAALTVSQMKDTPSNGYPEHFLFPQCLPSAKDRRRRMTQEFASQIVPDAACICNENYAEQLPLNKRFT